MDLDNLAAEAADKLKNIQAYRVYGDSKAALCISVAGETTSLIEILPEFRARRNRT
jgi:hypothetical protein